MQYTPDYRMQTYVPCEPHGRTSLHNKNGREIQKRLLGIAAFTLPGLNGDTKERVWGNPSGRKPVDLMGGAIGVESEQGVGSTFSVTLPRDKSVL